jgi:hypothetical protein
MAILKHNNNSISNVTSFALVPSGSPVLLATSTASVQLLLALLLGLIVRMIFISLSLLTATQLVMELILLLI